MKIEPMSEEMKWILLKFLKESLGFLQNPLSKFITPRNMTESWMEINLKEPNITNFLTAMMEIDKNE